MSAPIPALTPEENAIAEQLYRRVGRACCLSAKALAAQTGLSPRRVGQIIKHLVERHGMPIGSTCAWPRAGYWWIATADEALATRNSLLRRAVSILARVRAVDKADWLPPLMNQLAMRLKEDPPDANETL
jgi:hypothetical protein